ncbi:DUF4190 domain-containing protein [Herbivorax sp. ANBcel31]|uniref:DUF4190 domain-containing protein n=1 Tax=Herbivorax sp. ANBcel31 TaxID=3069754 RepID=UPI0027ADCB2F|nr:DUF4190 domain-containing protein [Herbivorax sp. ANBcel31]MDQ2084978.1 DUF4190 domain-containing protein [Herbivorax sp. ANBcel31]
MKTCPKCNSLNEEYEKVCTSCNQPLDSEGGGDSGYIDENSNRTEVSPNQAKTNGMAIASMVLGIVGIPLFCCSGIGIVPAALAVILGFISLNSIKKSGGIEKGKGMAIAGIIMGFIGVGLAIIVIIGLVFFDNEEFYREFMREMENLENMDY